MTPALVIVESPVVGLVLQRQLGEGFLVRATGGHLSDGDGGLGERRLLRGKGRVVQELARLQRGAPHTFLATDADREGDAIAWEIALALGASGRLLRARLWALEPEEVALSLSSARPLRRAPFDAVELRRRLDRRIAARARRAMLSLGSDGEAVALGRLQAAALAKLVEDARTDRASAASHYLRGRLAGREFELLDAHGAPRTFPSAADALAFAAGFGEEEEVELLTSTTETQREPPPPPLDTAALFAAADRAHGFSPVRTARVARALFEGVRLGEGERVGLITYPRTDGRDVCLAAASALDRVAREKFSVEPQPVAMTRPLREGHEAIRPVDPRLSPEHVRAFLSRDEARLYALVWSASVASRLSDAEWLVERIQVRTRAGAIGLLSRRLARTGHRMVGGVRVRSCAARCLRGRVRLGKLRAVAIAPPDDPTRAAALIERLTRAGVGRPSSFLRAIEALERSGLVVNTRGTLRPTSLGHRAEAQLRVTYPELLDAELSNALEAELDAVASGQRPARESERTLGQRFPVLRAGEARPPQREESARCRCGAERVVRFGAVGRVSVCPRGCRSALAPR